MASSGTDQQQKPDSSQAPTKRHRWQQKIKDHANATGATMAPPSDSADLVAERLQMVLERLYGPQYRAAQKFLKNRTLNKMNTKQPGMTLYDRIMAYRKLKEEEAPSSATQEGSSSAGGSQEVNSTPPAKRKLGSSRALERSDTSFSSVDISDLTNFDEEKNRTPTPPPTLEKAARSSKVLSSSHTSSPSVKTGKNKVRPTVSTRRAWEENSSPGVTRSLSEKDRVSSEKDRVSSAVHDGRLPEVDEQGQKSPVIKQLHPAYLEIPYIVATNGHYSTFAYLFRSKSVPDIVLGTDTSDNLDCKAGPPPGPISAGARGRRDRRSSRRSFQASNDLSLAQKVLLARRVEMYLAAQQSQRGDQGTYEEMATAREVHVELDDRQNRISQNERTKQESRQLKRQTSIEYEEEEKVKNKSEVKVVASEKVSISHKERIEEKYEDEKESAKATVITRTVKDVHSSVKTDAGRREEKTEIRKDERREDKRSNSQTDRRGDERSDSLTERKEEKASTSRTDKSRLDRRDEPPGRQSRREHRDPPRRATTGNDVRVTSKSRLSQRPAGREQRIHIQVRATRRRPCQQHRQDSRDNSC
ncbi:uncharacterized protein LOC112557716 isoform X1 [Pomacea canaliculata]|uniref:uncharacterized protein LOC112557716 isoform X1 n=1 Tax=Pomacea canaliculata TaxID=400727 RepID=UPI000D73B3AB|nr:uncharacterized protein LOC112557716 isoform X1 [Pomacea canaliculata]XP_025083500.1 uncharacterized protein LOC112557716 isoform X1 [Pomacea canaliculata]XP_025083501.1 uncharacterized protein LOC112557716 isoform X1 [Pomacea canaliculata]